MRKKLFVCIFFICFCVCKFFSIEKLNIIGLNDFKISEIQKNECLEYDQIIEDNIIELVLKAQNNEQSRILAKILYFTGHVGICNNGKVYFSVDNHNDEYDSMLYEYNSKNGKIKQLINAELFIVSADGIYICYHETANSLRKNKHDYQYWYLYNTKSKKTLVLIDKPFEHNYDVIGAKYDEDKNAFRFKIGFDNDTERILFYDPYKNVFLDN